MSANPSFLPSPPRTGASAPPRQPLPDERFVCLLEQIDYGLVVVGADLQVVYANGAARDALAGHHPLRVRDGELEAQGEHDTAQLHKALAAAGRGLRGLIVLGDDEDKACVAVVPLAAPSERAAPETLIVIGKRTVCEDLSTQWYARSHGLTLTETQVLSQICSGAQPTEIARRQGVAVSTIRTQIGSIRAKTGAATIGALVRKVAVLPPMVNALRAGARVPADTY